MKYTTKKVNKNYVQVLFEKQDIMLSKKISEHIAENYPKDKMTKILPSISSGYIQGFQCKKTDIKKILGK